MAVTRDRTGALLDLPRRHRDQKIIRKVRDDLGGWNLRRLVWVADRGFASAANRAYLSKGGGHYIHAEKLRNTSAEAAAALSRQGRYRAVAGNLQLPPQTPTSRLPSLHPRTARSPRPLECNQESARPDKSRGPGSPPERPPRPVGGKRVTAQPL